MEGKSCLMFLKFSLVMKKGLSIKEAIKSLEKTKVIGPTAGAAILIKRKEEPQATPIAMMRNQSITVFFCIFEF